MTDTDFHARRTELANAFAAAGAQLIDYMGAAGALAAIPNTQQYAVAGSIAAIRAQLDTVDPQRRKRHGDRPELDLYFGPETGQKRRWAALITSAGHGILQEYGTPFEHAQPGQEVLEVMEILPGSATANKAEVDPVTVDRAAVRDAVADSMTGLYHCGRVWSAWGYGTMSEGDFSPAGEDEDILDNITDAVIAAISKGATTPATTGASIARDQVLEEAAEAIDAMNDASGDAAAYDNREQNLCELEREHAISACAEKVRTLKGSVGASTVLTDERIWRMWQEDPCPGGSVKEMIISHTRAVLREVAAQAGQVAVSEGWKLVPIEPTLDMITDGFESAPDEFFSPAEEWEAYEEMTGCQKAAHRAKLCYAAMLAVAPSAPAVAQQAPTEIIAKLEKVSRWIDKFPVPTYGATAMMCHLRDVKEALSAAPAQAKPLPAEPGWISVDERLPDSAICLATYRNAAGKLRIIRAKYASQYEVDAGEDAIDQGNCEYNEADDTYYLKAGWLECVDNWGEYSSMYVTEGEVTHWMPLPPLPGAQASTAGERQKGGDRE